MANKTARIAHRLVAQLIGNGIVIETPGRRIRLRSGIDADDELVGAHFDTETKQLVLSFETEAEEDEETRIEGKVTIPPPAMQCGKCGTPLRGPWVSMAAIDTEDRRRAERMEGLLLKIDASIGGSEKEARR